MSVSAIEYLRHILDEADYLLAQRANLTESLFLAHETYKRAFVRSLEIIGEATKNLPDSFRQQHPDIPWRSMAGMRDRLIHGYFGVDYALVWDVVDKKIPEVHQQIIQILTDKGVL